MYGDANSEELRDAAQRLEELLRQLSATEPDARVCLHALLPIFGEVRSRGLEEPYESIPCGYYFHEGPLREYRDLEKAYSRFCVLAQGIDREELQRFIDSL